MNAWQVAAGLLLLCAACCVRSKWLLDRTSCRRWRVAVLDWASLLFIVAGGAVLIYGGLPKKCRDGMCDFVGRSDPVPVVGIHDTPEPPLAK